MVLDATAHLTRGGGYGGPLLFGPLSFGEPPGEGCGAVPLGDGDGDGLGDGDGPGSVIDGIGMIPVSDGVGFGLFEGDGLAVEIPDGFLSYLDRSGLTKSTTGSFSMATVMKSCQMAAGMVPPVTPATPSTFSMDFSDFRYPSQTHAASCGVYPQNHAFL
jgi:hypothetical protein